MRNWQVRVSIDFPNDSLQIKKSSLTLHVLKAELRCKLQEKLHRVTEPLGKAQVKNKFILTSRRHLSPKFHHLHQGSVSLR
jgi:hypothetical protein